MGTPVPGVGHNGGPSMDTGVSYRRFIWKKARKGLMGETLPIEVIRSRVARAKALGLPYKSYASIRASSGRDVVGFLFSSNALRLVRQADRLSPLYADRLAAFDVDRCVAAHRPVSLDMLADLDCVDRAGAAPRAFAPWSAQRAALSEILGPRLPRDGVVLISDAPFEAEWVEAARLGGHLRAEHFWGA